MNNNFTFFILYYNKEFIKNKCKLIKIKVLSKFKILIKIINLIIAENILEFMFIKSYYSFRIIMDYIINMDKHINPN